MPTKKFTSAAKQPRYSIPEAAKHIHVSASTLRSWVLGRPYPTSAGRRQFRPVIKMADVEARLLSFEDLVEAHVLRALRVKHKVELKSIRRAIKYVEKNLGIDRLLLSQELTTTAGELFVEQYGQLINASQSGQLAMKRVLENHLERVVWADRIVAAFYPFVDAGTGIEDRMIVIRPDCSFGKPAIARGGVSTAVITDRFDAGETIEGLSEDYDLNPQEIHAAILYERAA